jgi:hypothetical protein
MPSDQSSHDQIGSCSDGGRYVTGFPPQLPSTTTTTSFEADFRSNVDRPIPLPPSTSQFHTLPPSDPPSDAFGLDSILRTVADDSASGRRLLGWSVAQSPAPLPLPHPHKWCWSSSQHISFPDGCGTSSGLFPALLNEAIRLQPGDRDRFLLDACLRRCDTTAAMTSSSLRYASIGQGRNGLYHIHDDDDHTTGKMAMMLNVPVADDLVRRRTATASTTCGRHACRRRLAVDDDGVGRYCPY